MTIDLRKNPRHLSLSGVTARLSVAGKACEGHLQDFSVAGFSVIAAVGEIDVDMPLEVFFTDGSEGSEFHLDAVVINNRPIDGGLTRLGCQITGLHGKAEAYWGFMGHLLV